MMQPKVIIIYLRRPRKNDENEMRSDPFWEFGSFGCTRCHRKNVMNPKKLHLLDSARFAFAQGGKFGTRLVYLTPEIKVVNHGDFGEAKWQPTEMPFKYVQAPLLINNDGCTDFSRLKQYIEKTNRTSWEGKFASRFRNRRKPLKRGLAREIVSVFEQKVKIASSNSYAVKYVDALPYCPNKIDHNREQTYLRCLEQSCK